MWDHHEIWEEGECHERAKVRDDGGTREPRGGDVVF